MNNPTLKDTMSKSVISVRWNHSMQLAAELMARKRIRHLPVIGDDGAVVGILSDRDVKRALDPIYSAYSPRSQVSDYMNWPVLTKSDGAPLLEVVDLMIKEKISSVIITKSGAMLGIVTSEDLLVLLRDLLTQENRNPALLLTDLTTSPFFVEAIREANAAGI